MIDETTLLQFFGRLHPLVLHLPIGLWLGITLLEFGGALVRRRTATATLVVLAWTAALGGAVSATAGWVLALEGGYGDRTLQLHRWLGVAAASFGLCAAAVASLRSRRAFRILLVAELGTLLAAGHFGSSMTHGDDWLTEPFAPRPAANDRATGTSSSAPPTVDPALAGGASPKGAPAGQPVGGGAGSGSLTFAGDVLPLLQLRCGKCHGETKPKGKLVLRDQAGIERGGENGAVLVAGKPDDSELVRRIVLPLDDEDHMPPKAKPQVTAAELLLLRRWIDGGAPFAGAFAASPAPAAAPTDTAGGDQPAGTDSPGGATGTPSDAPKSPPAPVDDHPRSPAEDPRPTGPAHGEPAPVVPVPSDQTGKPEPGGSKPGGGDPAAPAPAASLTGPSAVAVAALRARQVPTATTADGGLSIDFARVAATTTEAEVRTLLSPVAGVVVELGLARVPMGAELLALCARMPRLRRLDLGGTKVGARGLQQLRSLPQLEQLALADVSLDDDAVAALLQLPALRTLQLGNSTLSPGALAALHGRRDLAVLGTAADDAATATAIAAALRPGNANCPVTGKPIDPQFAIVRAARTIGFCSADCAARYWREPDRYPISDR